MVNGTLVDTTLSHSGFLSMAFLCKVPLVLMMEADGNG